jgi:cell wall-associated NlpC family hydrolase
VNAPDWVQDEIGTPWVAGTSDCWSFARAVWRRRFGLDVPAMPYDAASALDARRGFGAAGNYAGWRAVEPPEKGRDGDAVVMARGPRPCHIGILVAGGVRHCIAGPGAIWTPEGRLADLGWRVAGLWRPA